MIAKYEEEAEKKPASVSYGKILLTYADRTDKVLMILGYFFAVGSGLGMPAFSYLLGDIIVNFTDPKISMLDAVRPVIIRFAIVGAIMFLTGYSYFVLLSVMAERIGKKTKVAYLQAILR